MNREDKIRIYIDELTSWNTLINLTNVTNGSKAYKRHVVDSHQLTKYIRNDEIVLDIGAGAGFPGIILSIYGYDNIILCEKSFKKCVFLNEIRSKLELNCRICNCDIKDIQCHKLYITPQVAISRAYSSLPILINIMHDLQIGRGVFHKGRNYQKELDNAQRDYIFGYQIFPSETSTDGVILEITSVGRRL